MAIFASRQCHACWCTGDFRSQCISRHGIGPQRRNVANTPPSEELTLQDKQILVICEEGLKPPAPSLCWDMMQNANFFYVSWDKLSLTRVNSSWPSDAISRHRSGSTVAQVMTCCLMAPSHYQNQCWLVIGHLQGPVTFIWGQFHKR